ncbi:hypothetical protein AaE_000569 [Aphanomyces astaci]|uniref:PSMD12/CSN4-like N-terminal domain-containing protein n=1 Tax=Aphanomyces astaci TaxID=112090 RepID=A0A6A5AZ42_APHAT|nr:hypothetical protein AaE_000569 [Aphanomyces astaci]
MSITAELSKIAKIQDQKEKLTAYKELVDATFQDFTSLKATFDHSLDESVQLAVSRGLLTHLASSVLVRIDPDVHAWKKDLLAYCLNKIKPRILSFEEADIVLREVLCDLLMDEEDYIEAAKTLAAINLESSARYNLRLHQRHPYPPSLD